MNKMDDQTVMTEAETSLCDTTGAVDVRWRVMTLPAGVLGQSACTHPDPWSYPCAQSYAAADLNNHGACADDGSCGGDGNPEAGEIALNLDLTACHELGHTIGMAHHNLAWYQTEGNDCMRNPWLEAHQADDGWKKYNTHHVDHVRVEVN